jgi:Collagen triple helix repeat (20 copies)
MRSRHLIRISAVAGACAAAMALGGLQLADASSSAPAAKTARSSVWCFKYDADDTPQCLGQGPRGKAGLRGVRGRKGVTGGSGKKGPVGPRGATGPKGAVGIQGIQGVVGNPGAFTSGGSDPGGQMVTITGTSATYHQTTSPGGTGTEIEPPVTARCPVGGPTPEAYDGGVTISLSGTHTASDVVSLESSYPGIYVSSTEVDPLPIGSAPGGVSPEPANAYEAVPVVTIMGASDSAVATAYVVCGP